MKITAEFVTSAADAAGIPCDGLPRVALVGRSNVGKSRLINALVRRPLARTSAAPGKTRLANVYRVARGSHPPFYLIDLPGYGYARAPRQARRGLSSSKAGGREEFAPLVDDFFLTARGRESTLDPSTGSGPSRARSRDEAEGRRRRDQARGWGPAQESKAGGGPPPLVKAALLLVDARHPGLASDRQAWAWMAGSVDSAAIVAAKIDKLARGERIRALREHESVFDCAVLPVSAVTGEGLDDLWNLIDRLTTARRINPRASRRRSGPRATGPRPPATAGRKR